MNRQARVLLNFISSSSSGDFSALQDTSAQHSYYQRLICFLLSRSTYTSEGFEFLGRQLADVARHAYLAKQMEIVEQVSQIMLALPLSDQLRNIARHYQALCAKQKRDFDTVRRLLERIVEETTPQYRARALQIIGATYQEQGKYDLALPFYVVAGKAAISYDLPTVLESQRNIAVIRSIHGDHKQALEDIESLFPLVRLIAKSYPTLYYDYLNSLAVELGEVGRINEARRVCQITLASPYAQAYPEWLETRDELEAKRTDATPSVVAVGAVVEPTPSPKVQQQRNIKPAPTLAFIQLACKQVLIQTSIAVAVKAIARLKTTASILSRVRHSIITRGPPACC